jgi:tetratricopeptide (TPR) repeat protein
MTLDEANRIVAIAREAKLSGPQAASWVERLSPMRLQLIASARTLTENGEQQKALELAASTWRLFLISGETAQGRAMLEAALDGKSAPTSARAMALYADGLLAFRQGNQGESRARNQEALIAARAAGDKQAEALALVGLSRVALRDKDYAKVRSLAAAARELVRNSDPSFDAAPIHLLAAGTRLSGEYDEAARLYSESLELNRRLGDSRGVGMEHVNLGYVELHRRNLEAAEQHFRESNAYRNQGDPYEQAVTHLSEAAVALAKGDRERAKEELASAKSILEGAGIALDPDDAFEVSWVETGLSN